MIYLTKYLKKYIPIILIAFILLIFQAIINLKLPEYMSKIIDIGIYKHNINYILNIGLVMISITLLWAVASIIISLIAAQIGYKFSMRVRNDLFEKVESFSTHELNEFGISSLITRTTNDIEHVQQFLMMFFRVIVMTPIISFIAISKIMTSSVSLVWIIIVAVVVLVIFISIIFILAVPRFKIMQTLIDKLNLVTRESLSGIRVVRAFNNEKYQEEKFDKANDYMNKNILFINRIMGLLNPGMTLIMSVTTLGLLWFGSRLVGSNDLMVGELVSYAQYAGQVMISFLMLTVIFIFMPRALISAARIKEVLIKEISIKDPKEEKKLDNSKDEIIEFNHVYFKYPNAKKAVLKDINFEIKKGETVAIIGGTGSGKTTLADLIMRFFDVTSGSILLNNVDIRDIKQKTLRSKIGYISQKGVLFKGTIESNIKFGINASKEDIKEVINMSEAYEFINSKKSKEKSEVSQKGTNLSGGQKQRIAIARALLRRPDIYIFDDSFSALDYITDKKLRDTLSNKLSDSTIIIIAQRISTVLNCDKIVVLDKGEIVGIGKHKDLMKTSKVYKEIALSQLSKEELL
ncbi:MAG TPA: ABC transporter ATP-binding protein [Bacilli bacterium]|nr:ABC transporter ATP-binding protein [Bacilli bacterium]